MNFYRRCSLLLFVFILAESGRGACPDVREGVRRRNRIFTVDSMLTEYRDRGRRPQVAERLEFADVGGKDVYNPTKPFRIGGKTVLAARVESRDSETDTVSMFFEWRGNAYRPIKNVPVFKMQDPFYTFIGGELILGGVEIFERPEGGLGYRTAFFRGKSLKGLKNFATGPDKMKDIRLVELPGGGIGVFTRPQGKMEGTSIDGLRGRVGFTVIRDLSKLTPDLLRTAPLIRLPLDDAEWMGVNEVTLAGNRLSVLGHIAKFGAEGDRHYYAVHFLFNPVSGRVTKFRILLERADLVAGLNGQSKRADLRDVIFSGGMAVDEGGSTWLYVGAGDAEVHRARIGNPILE